MRIPSGVIVVGLLAFIGCSGSKDTQSSELLAGEEKIVDASQKEKPNWISRSSDLVDGDMYVTGLATKAFDMSFGLNQSHADGIQKLMNTMGNNVKTWTTQALQGANLSEGDVGRMSKFAVGWVSDTKRISGVTVPETYWEKVQRYEGKKVTYSYNCYTLLKMGKSDYDAAVSGAYEEMKRQAQKEQNQRAEQVADDLLRQLNTAK